MILAQLGIEFQTWANGLGLLQLALAAVIVVLTYLGYRRNASRAMLVLGAGIASLTIAPVLTRLLVQATLGLQNTAVVAMGFETLGLALILYSILVARRNA